MEALRQNDEAFKLKDFYLVAPIVFFFLKLFIVNIAYMYF